MLELRCPIRSFAWLPCQDACFDADDDVGRPPRFQPSFNVTQRGRFLRESPRDGKKTPGLSPMMIYSAGNRIITAEAIINKALLYGVTRDQNDIKNAQEITHPNTIYLARNSTLADDRLDYEQKS